MPVQGLLCGPPIIHANATDDRKNRVDQIFSRCNSPVLSVCHVSQRTFRANKRLELLTIDFELFEECTFQRAQDRLGKAAASCEKYN